MATAESAKKQPYSVPIAKVVAPCAGRLAERITARIVCGYTDQFNGKQKTVAVLADGANLQDVLCLESWGPVDGACLQKLIQKKGKVVCLDKAKVGLKHKSLTFGGKAVKVLFDTQTVVTEVSEAESAKFPTTLPLMSLAETKQLTSTCFASFQVVIHETGAAIERDVKGRKRTVCNLKVALASHCMSAAFWDQHAAVMSSAQKNDCFLLDYVCVSLEGDNIKLNSCNGTACTKITGDEAAKTLKGVSSTPTSLSAEYGRTRASKLSEACSKSNLSVLGHIAQLDTSSGAYSRASLEVPATYVKAARGLGEGNVNGFYIGCPTCRKVLRQRQPDVCPAHGQVTGTNVERLLLTLQDPHGIFEATIWSEALTEFAASLGLDNVIEDNFADKIVAQARATEYVARFWVSSKSSGDAQQVELLSLVPTVRDDGAMGLYQGTGLDIAYAGDGLVPACCKHLARGALGQLTITVASGQSRTIDQAVVVMVLQDSRIEVMKDIDGIAVEVVGQCAVCDGQIKLLQEGAPSTVKEALSLRKKDVVKAHVILNEAASVFQVVSLRAAASESQLYVKSFKHEAVAYTQFLSGGETFPSSRQLLRR